MYHQPLVDTEIRELPVTFSPPLYLERRRWVFDILRKEGVRVVLDVGCGEGELISCLCYPAPWLPPPPPSVLQSLLSRMNTNPDTYDWHDNSNDYLSCEHYLHPIKVLGLDVSVIDLEYALEGTKPPSAPSSDKERWSHIPSVRWEPLEVQIWKGTLEVPNAEFIDIECIVCTEVIEHLHPPILSLFAPTLLGIYHPRLLLLTTPSYDFNARFAPPKLPEHLRTGYPDPTGRTTRVFRHSDHKFEWTIDEFCAWCEHTASEWGYEVEVGGVGKPMEKDEWGRDESLGWASQTAAFRRIEGKEWEARRRERCQENGYLRERKSGVGEEAHILLAAYHHPPHASSQHPLSLDEVGTLVASTMSRYHERKMRLTELWYDSDAQVGIACGGWVEVLIAAINSHIDLALDRGNIKTVADWVVEYTGTLEEISQVSGLCEEAEPSSYEDDERSLASSNEPDTHTPDLDDSWPCAYDAGEHVDSARTYPVWTSDKTEEAEQEWGPTEGWGSTEGWGIVDSSDAAWGNL